nr:diguanylate cyclase [Aliikangiella sp. G2MR2-5]
MPGRLLADISRPIPYCVDPDWMPYEAIRDGRHVGISSDYLELISDMSGLIFTLVATSSWNESLEKLRSGECEATPLLNRTPLRSTFLNFSNVYFESPNVLVSTKDEPFLQSVEHIGNRNVAVPEGYRLAEYIKVNHPEVNLKLVKNELDGLLAVSRGEIDLFVGSMLTVNSRIYSRNLNNLKIAGWAGPEDKLRFGVIHKRVELLPKINSAIAKVTEQQRQDIFKRWNNIRIIQESNYKLVLQVVSCALVILLILYFRNRSVEKFNLKLTRKNRELDNLRKKLEESNKKLEYLSIHDPLTNLYNRNYLNQEFVKDMRRKSSSGLCLILIDIDYFKKINDEFGHHQGDKVLKQFSNTLINSVRDSDVVTRWGGEEFIIICNHSKVDEAYHLCERIQQSIEQQDFSPVERITASFGIAEIKQNESINQGFERADAALYIAKDKGRNLIISA